jgi:hypothetical protein
MISITLELLHHIRYIVTIDVMENILMRVTFHMRHFTIKESAMYY